ncbi:MAG TPA: chemotaxis protein CheA [Halanaerobiales bacterium]|nr:chemotaxis protein CheA [Halanaerobiales bacterium]
MSDNNEYLEMFFAESEEYLMILNDNILKLENDPENMEVLNSLFRAAHSLKGMAATMRFNNLTELTHKMENMLDQIRNHKMKVNTEIIDLLFAGIDFIEETVKQIKDDGSDEIDFSDYLQQLEKKINEDSTEEVITAEKEEVEVAAGGDYLSVSEDDLQTINENKKELDSLFAVNVYLDSDTQFKQVRASMILKAAGELGHVFKSVPKAAEVEEAELEDDKVKILMISNQDKENIVDEFEGITDVSEIKIKKLKTEVKDNKKQDKTKKSKKSSSSSSSSSFEVSSSVRVDIGKLDKLMNMIGELLINKTRLEALNIDSEGFKDVLPQLDRVTMELHHTVMQIRMEPIGVMFNRFPRMIRDLSKSSEKEIDFIMEGKQTELDRSIIDELGDPLTHLLRNAVDHGIEKPAKRVKKGKDKTGTVNLRAYQKGSEIIIEVEDDGDGINVDKVVEKAIDKDVITQKEIEEMERDKKLQLIFEPGLSTNEKVSNVSGRGVGMDVVKRTIESLDGEIYIRSQENEGTKFVISLPLTLAIQDALMVKIDGEIFAIPLSAISETLMIQSEEIKQVKGYDVIVLRDKTIPLIDSRESLNIEIGDDSYIKKSEMPVVIVKSSGKEIGLIVEELLYQQEIVIKSLSNYLDNVKNISGATIIGDGEVALILDVRDIA